MAAAADAKPPLLLLRAVASSPEEPLHRAGTSVSLSLELKEAHDRVASVGRIFDRPDEAGEANSLGAAAVPLLNGLVAAASAAASEASLRGGHDCRSVSSVG